MQSIKLPELGYAFDALEPFISKEIMEIHYSKHHQAYVNNFNIALEKAKDAESRGDVGQMIALQQALKFNGGGHINHSIFWTNLAPQSQGGGKLEKGPLHAKILEDFGTVESFKEQMSALGTSLQGSGWVWLGYDRGTKRLVLVACSNQDPLVSMGYIPLLGIDVWEHAYYLQYKNVRAEYIKNIWNIINYKNVEERYLAASM
jgi:superoxide dismutase, Fe-Mn family